jgi:predicted nuclease of predicted toxin-antitoxin system
MKLLFDQNLSFKLVRQLRDVFPDSNQVRLLELDRAKDEKLWKYARDNDYVFVTQDVDYSHLSSLHGFRPKSSGCAAAISPQPSSRICCAPTIPASSSL